MTERNGEFIQRGEHIRRMLLHGVIGVVAGWNRSVAVSAAAPVDADHTNAAGKKRGSEFDPVLAGKIAVDEEDCHVALPPFSPAELDLSRLHPRHGGYLFKPAVGEAPGGVGATGNAETTEPLIMRSVASGELVSTLPLITKSTTSTGNSTGLSV